MSHMTLSLGNREEIPSMLLKVSTTLNAWDALWDTVSESGTKQCLCGKRSQQLALEMLRGLRDACLQVQAFRGVTMWAQTWRGTLRMGGPAPGATHVLFRSRHPGPAQRRGRQRVQKIPGSNGQGTYGLGSTDQVLKALSGWGRVLQARSCNCQRHPRP